MSELKKKKRLRSVLLVGAVSAMACGGKAEGKDGGTPREGAGDGDGDGYIDYGPVGEPPDYIGTGGGGWVGAIPTGGTFIGATGGYPIGTGGFSIGTEDCPISEPSCIGVPGEPEYTGGTPGLGGMGGGSEAEDDETVGSVR